MGSKLVDHSSDCPQLHFPPPVTAADLSVSNRTTSTRPHGHTPNHKELRSQDEDNKTGARFVPLVVADSVSICHVL
jgi:hypothetical protein